MTYENLDRQAEVIFQFSPFMSCTRTLPVQLSSKVGITCPTPYPDRVGAMQATCSSLLSHRIRPSGEPRTTTPSEPKRPADLYSSGVAQRADPCHFGFVAE